MGALTTAIERQEWELAALCLALGVTRAAAALPPEAVEALLETLQPEGNGEPGRRRASGRRQGRGERRGRRR